MDRIDCLRAFVRSLEGGSFSVAANELGVGQPAVSKRIALLEREFGTQLFFRTTRKLKPTPRGPPHLRSGPPDSWKFRSGARQWRGKLTAAERHAAGEPAVVVRPALSDARHCRICPDLSGRSSGHPLQRAFRQSRGGGDRAGAADRTTRVEHAGRATAWHGAALSGRDADLP